MNNPRRLILPLPARPHFLPGGMPVVSDDEPLLRQSVANNGGQVFAWLASVPWNSAPPRPSRATTQNGGPVYADYELGRALSLNGTTNGLQFGNLASIISGAGSMSFSFWIKTSGSTTGRIFGQWSGTGADQNFLLSATTSQIELATKGTAASVGQCRCNTAVTANKATHVVVTWAQANNTTFYYNGAPLAKTNTISGAGGNMTGSASTQWQLGYETAESSAPITGLIDNLRVFTRELTQAEVLELYFSPYLGYTFGRGGVLSSLVARAAVAGAKQVAVTVVT